MQKLSESVQPPGQGELFEAQTQWFHIFKAMIDSGDMAKLPGSAVKVYMVIKSHTNFATGQAFPAIETISAKSGLSTAQVKRELKHLESFGYIVRSKRGRSNVYTLREKVEIYDGVGRPAAVATWDYLPSGVQQAVADLKHVLVTGNLAGAKVVHIERLQVNITHVHDSGININIQDVLADMAKLPPAVREKLLKGILASNTRNQNPQADDVAENAGEKEGNAQ